MNHTLWDDFPYVHFQSNDDIHFAASFLTWHRYIIHTYHQALVTECGYKGELPYWDWTLDWQNLSAAPVWDLDHGFSGNGRESAEPSAFFPRSHCIKDGTFANVNVSLAGATYAPHCLTRDFGSFKHEPVASLSQHLRPSAIEALMEEDDYYEFLVKFEDGAHIAIPKFIMGDFRLFTSPNGRCFQFFLTIQYSSSIMGKLTGFGGGGSNMICNGDNIGTQAALSPGRKSKQVSMILSRLEVWLRISKLQNS
ncbi:Di-copper centre-containing protein [Alternaria alternata]|nr:Di-copper centre-containing protein [Alternaria alternata]